MVNAFFGFMPNLILTRYFIVVFQRSFTKKKTLHFTPYTGSNLINHYELMQVLFCLIDNKMSKVLKCSFELCLNDVTSAIQMYLLGIHCLEYNSLENKNSIYF